MIVIVVAITCDLKWFLGFASDLRIPHSLGATNCLHNSTYSLGRLVLHLIYFSFIKFHSRFIYYSDHRGSMLSSKTFVSLEPPCSSPEVPCSDCFVKLFKIQKGIFTLPLRLLARSFHDGGKEGGREGRGKTDCGGGRRGFGYGLGYDGP